VSELSVVRTVRDLRTAVADMRQAGDRIGLVPTMGALHAAHMALVEAARHHADRVVATIFVNPTQFGPDEDFSTYPRREARDIDTLCAHGVDLLFAPSVDEMYPDGFETVVEVPEISRDLCGAHRPGHFAGVATIVTKLLLQALPDCAVFGEKDYQQLQVIRRLARDLDIPVEIVWGMNDPILGRALPVMQANFPDAPVTKTAAGHFLQEEVPQEIAEAIQRVYARTLQDASTTDSAATSAK